MVIMTVFLVRNSGVGRYGVVAMVGQVYFQSINRLLDNMKRYKTETGIFIYFLFVRISFIILSGFNTCELCSDSGWIDMLSERVLAGNFDFDIGRFIVAPFYNIFIAIHKIIFQRYWTVALISSQLILSSLSGVCLYKIGSMLFERRTALVSTAIFCVFPMTLWWVHTFCTESIFQSLLIISLFFLLKTVYTARYLYLILSAIIFSITFLTKAHILLYSPFLALYLFSLKTLQTTTCLSNQHGSFLYHHQ
ncbi:MAG: hypothetical protein D3905_13745 [Candidatus Electrothrix sp. AS4_5]|nr:hypothetical protein [Candidatus Electrothrix gigas]